METITPLIGQIAGDGEWGWIVNVLTAAVGALLLIQLRDIKHTVSEILNKVQNHGERIAVLENQVERIEEDEE